MFGGTINPETQLTNDETSIIYHPSSPLPCHSPCLKIEFYQFPVAPFRISDPLAYMAIVRPINCAIAFASVLVGACMSGGWPEGYRVIAAGLSAACIAAGGNALNDVCDEAADRINRPDRPIASSRISLRGASVMAGVLFATGGVLSFSLGAKGVCIAFAAIGGLVAYDGWFKRVPVFGNAVVAGISSLALIYGGIAANHVAETLVPAGFAYLIHLGREILKDVEDMEGDIAIGARSVAITWGVRTSLGLTTAVFLSLIGLTPVPFFFGLYDWLYLIIVICPVDAILLYTLISMWQDRSRGNLRRLDVLIKINMVFGLVALLAGSR